jgi:hypothetical protein
VLPGTAFPHASTATIGGHNGRGYTSVARGYGA